MAAKRYDIVVIPSPEVADAAVAISRSLQEAGSLFALDGETLFPHVSLYHMEFPEKAVSQVISALESAIPALPAFPLTQDAYRASEGIWIGVSYRKDRNIASLHEAVIAATRGFRDMESGELFEGMILKEKWQSLSPERQKNMVACGWSEAYDLYLPHMTFGRLAAPNAGIINTLPPHEFSFQAERIGLYELGAHGTCTKLIHEFRLA